MSDAGVGRAGDGDGDTASGDRDMAPGDREIADYQRAAQAHQRTLRRRAAATLGIGALAGLGLATRMTDIGHAVGFAGLALVLLVSAFVVIRSGGS